MGLFDKFVKKGKEKNKKINETRQKNITKEYYEDVSFKYKDSTINVRLKPISKENLANLKTKNSKPEELVYSIIQHCLLNKRDNKQFTLEQVKQLFEFDLSTKLALKCLEVSDIPIDKYKSENNERDGENIKKVKENKEQKNTDDQPFDKEIMKRALSEMKKAQKNIPNPYEEESGKLDINKVNSETTKWRMFLNKNNAQAYQSLKEGNLEQAISFFEESVNAWDTTQLPYENLVQLYCLKEDYENEIRICDSAIENLFGYSKLNDYIIRKEDAIKRKENEVKLNIDEELYAILIKEKRESIGGLNSKEERKTLTTEKNEYLEKNPTNFLLKGSQLYGRSWFSSYTEIEDMKFLIALSGKGKYLEEQEEYEQAISVYQEAEKYEKKRFPYPNQRRVKRIEICNNKLKKQKIKELETNAKELEKTDPVQAIELYNELNLLNPGLKKYNKRIELLNKKI